MAKQKKERADKYEEKVSFDGTFEDMINMSVRQANQNAAPKEDKSATFQYRDGDYLINGLYVYDGEKMPYLKLDCNHKDWDAPQMIMSGKDSNGKWSPVGSYKVRLIVQRILDKYINNSDT